MARRHSGNDPAKRTISEEVYDALKRDVLTLAIAPGAPIREQEVAERYGSSRVPVREALSRLHQEGFLDSVPYRGYTARQISLREIADSFDLRLVLETHAAELAAEKASAEELDELDRLGAIEYRPKDVDSYTEFLDLNLEYHVAIAEVAGNTKLKRALRELLESMQRFFFLGLDLGDYGGEMRGEHEELNTLLRARDAQGAAECVRYQIQTSKRRILDALLEGHIELPLE